MYIYAVDKIWKKLERKMDERLDDKINKMEEKHKKDMKEMEERFVKRFDVEAVGRSGMNDKGNGGDPVFTRDAWAAYRPGLDTDASTAAGSSTMPPGGDPLIVQVLGFGENLRRDELLKAAREALGETPGFPDELAMTCRPVDNHVRIRFGTKEKADEFVE